MDAFFSDLQTFLTLSKPCPCEGREVGGRTMGGVQKTRTGRDKVYLAVAPQRVRLVQFNFGVVEDPCRGTWTTCSSGNNQLRNWCQMSSNGSNLGKSAIPSEVSIMSRLRKPSTAAWAMVLLAQKYRLPLQAQIESLRSLGSPSYGASIKMLGRMVAAFDAVPHVQFHSRALQHNIVLVWDKRPWICQYFWLPRPDQLWNAVYTYKCWIQENPSVRVLEGLEDRCQAIRLGRYLWEPLSSGNLVFKRVEIADQHPGTLGNLSGFSTMVSITFGSPHQGKFGQCHGCVEYINHQGGTRSRLLGCSPG